MDQGGFESYLLTIETSLSQETKPSVSQLFKDTLTCIQGSFRFLRETFKHIEGNLIKDFQTL